MLTGIEPLAMQRNEKQTSVCKCLSKYRMKLNAKLCSNLNDSALSR